MAAIFLVATIVAVLFACNKEEEKAAIQSTIYGVERLPIATFNNATEEMTYSFGLYEIQQKWNENLASKTNQDRFIIESIQVLDSLPNDIAVLPEVKITLLDTEEVTTYTFWLMQNFTEKEVAQNGTIYYVETEVSTGVYEFGYRIGNQYYKVSVNGDNCVTTEIDSPMCMTSGLPKFLLWCRSENCTKTCAKNGTWYNAGCDPCGDDQGGKCTEELQLWVDVVGIIVGIVGIVVALL